LRCSRFLAYVELSGIVVLAQSGAWSWGFAWLAPAGRFFFASFLMRHDG
jgi:hypothetical protein